MRPQCEHCGAYLDYGEKCDCNGVVPKKTKKKKKATAKAVKKKQNRYYGAGLSVPELKKYLEKIGMR